MRKYIIKEFQFSTNIVVTALCYLATIAGFSKKLTGIGQLKKKKSIFLLISDCKY